MAPAIIIKSKVTAPSAAKAYGVSDGEEAFHTDSSLRTQSLKISYDIPLKSSNRLSLTPALVYTNVRSDDMGGQKVYHVRVEGSAKYLASEKVSLLGGLNFGKWQGDSETLNDQDPNLGAQAGVLVSLTKTVQLSAQYSYVSNTKKKTLGSSLGDYAIEFETQIKALEVGVNLAF